VARSIKTPVDGTVIDARETMPGWRRTLALTTHFALLTLILLAFVYVTWRYVTPAETVRNVDYFQFIELGQGLTLDSLRGWVNGMHPNGYPLLVRWGLALGLDAVETGHILSIAGGVLLLLSAFLLAYQLTRNLWLALATQGFLAMTGYFLYFSTWEGNDMLSAGLQAMSLALLVGFSGRKMTYLGAAVLAGLAYVIRYTALVTSGLCLVFLVGQALLRRRRSDWIAAGLFLLGFLAGAAIQIIPSTLVTGNPFYSVQGRNLWWHLEGLSDFATEWNLAPEDTSLLSLILEDPGRFVQHWWETTRSFWLDPGMLLLDRPLRLLTQAALIFTLLAATEISGRKRLFLAFYVLGFLAALAVIRYDPRFMLALLPILTFSAVYFVWAIVPRQVTVRRFKIPVGVLTLLVLLFSAWGVPQYYIRNRASSDSNVLAVTRVLRASGMRSADEVLSSAIPFHDVSVPARTRYAQSYWVAADMDSLDDLQTLAQERGYLFFLYDAQTGPAAHPGLQSLLNPYSRPTRLTPLWIAENGQTVLYRIEPDAPQPTHPLDVLLDEDIALTGYDLYVTQDAPEMDTPRIGLFLYWQATQPISRSYKVFVHVTDANDQLVAQDDSTPALWTHPTANWREGEVIIDFHTISLPAGIAGGTCTLQVGMYDEQTMQRLVTFSPAGGPADDKVTLNQLSLPPSD
jgi:hypothetical protein